MERALIPALFFDANGCGPDELLIVPHWFEAELDGAIPASFGLRLMAGGMVIGNAPVGGGLHMHREQVVQLREQLDAWLAAHPAEVG